MLEKDSKPTFEDFNFIPAKPKSRIHAIHSLSDYFTQKANHFDVQDQQNSLKQLNAQGRFKRLKKQQKTTEILENKDIIYIGFTWIGCCGFLLLKHNNTIIQLGSYTSAPRQIWAYYQGFSFRGEHPDRLNDVNISQIHDIEGTLKIMRLIFTKRYVREELGAQLRQDGHATFKDIDIFFDINHFFEAQSKQLFEFQITRPSSSRLQPQTKSTDQQKQQDQASEGE